MGQRGAAAGAGGIDLLSADSLGSIMAPFVGSLGPCSSALHKPLLHAPLEGGHCRRFNTWVTMVTHMHRQTSQQGSIRNKAM